MRPPRKLRRTPEDRSLQIGKRMSAGTAQGRVDSASPVRNTIPAKATQRRGGDCVNEEFTWFKTGTLTVGTSTERWYPPFEVKLFSVHIAVGGDEPTGSSIKVDILKNGTSIFTSLAHVPTIAVSSREGSASFIDDPLMALGDYLTFDISQVGSTIAGSDLAVTIGFTVCPSALATPGAPSPPASDVCDPLDVPVCYGEAVLVSDFSGAGLSWFDSHTGCAIVTGVCKADAFKIGQGDGALKDLPASYNEIYVRTSFKFTDWPAIGEGGTLIAFYDDSLERVGEWGMTYDGSQKLTYWRDGTLMATATDALTTNTWYFLEIHLKIDDSAGIFNVKVNGTTHINFTGDTKPGSSTTVNQIRWVDTHHSGAFFIYDDNFFVYDASGC